MSEGSDPHEWIVKARQDARSARRLLADPAELETAAYHVQQAVEKAAKAVLTAERIGFPRGRGVGHDLGVLARLLPTHSPLRMQAQALSDLTPWATVYRNPADDPFTAEPLPAKHTIEAKLTDTESFVEAVARLVASIAH